MAMRCYWCDSDNFVMVLENGEIAFSTDEIPDNAKAKDYSCAHCSHLVSEGNPRAGDPEETVESLKEERDELRQELQACKPGKQA